MAADPAVFTAAYRVRFDEAGPDGCLRTSGILRYTQDLASRHSEALGYDRAWYRARGLTWLVRTAELEVAEPTPFALDLRATTRVVGFRRVWARRETGFTLPDGRVAARVRIDWVLLDEAGRPARIPPEFEAVFGVRPADLGLLRVPVGDPPPGAARRAFRVRPQELDPLDHVNNAVYADWLDEAVGTDARAVPRRVRLEYAAAADPAAELEAAAWRDEGGWTYRLRTAGPAGTELLRARLEPGGR